MEKVCLCTYLYLRFILLDLNLTRGGCPTRPAPTRSKKPLLRFVQIDTMKLNARHLILAATALPSHEARSTLNQLSLRGLMSSDAVVAKPKRKFTLPSFGRRRSSSTDDVEPAAPAEDETIKNKDVSDAEESKDIEQSTDSDEPTTAGESSEVQAQPDEKDGSSTNPEQTSSSETQTTNSTRPTILFMPPPHQQQQHMRPFTPPYYMPQQPPQRRQKKRPSFLPSILPAFIPSGPPNNMPPFPHPPNPYNPNPSNEISNTILSLLLRLTLLTFTTHILDFFGLGSHSEAFLPSPAQHYTFERVNDRYRRDGNALSLALSTPPPGVRKYRWRRILGHRRRDVVHTLSKMENDEKQLSQRDNRVIDTSAATLDNGALYNNTVIIIDIKADGRVGNGMAEHLRDSISFIIEQHRDHLDKRRVINGKGSQLQTNSRTAKGIRSALGTNLEVLLLLDSPGGTVSDYGLASSHLTRLRDEPHITLSVCIDRVAASGGYMMACQATPGHLFAAPFAMVGSIGVLMETINFNDILNKYGVKPLTIKAGKHKAPLKSLGEVTEEEIDYAQKDADHIHRAFQRLVVSSRPNIKANKAWIEKVCTGSVFLGKEAHELGLVDQVKTSDEYVAERIAAGDRVLRLIPYKGPQFSLKLSPLDLLLSGMDAEGRAKIREFAREAKGFVASLCRVGGAVGVLNAMHHLASLSLRSGNVFLNQSTI